MCYRDGKVHYSVRSRFFCWISLGIAEIIFSVCISCPIALSAFHSPGWTPVVYIPFVIMVKFQFFAQSPLDHIAQPVMSSILLFFSQLLLLLLVFHISISWWSFTGDWVTTSLLKSPGLFSLLLFKFYFGLLQSFNWPSPKTRMRGANFQYAFNVIIILLLGDIFQSHQ